MGRYVILVVAILTLALSRRTGRIKGAGIEVVMESPS